MTAVVKLEERGFFARDATLKSCPIQVQAWNAEAWAPTAQPVSPPEAGEGVWLTMEPRGQSGQAGGQATLVS